MLGRVSQQPGSMVLQTLNLIIPFISWKVNNRLWFIILCGPCIAIGYASEPNVW